MNKGKICVSVYAETADEMIAKIHRAEEFADVIEVRFDGLENGNFRGLFERLPDTKKTYLFTFRPKEQGGKRDLTIGERLKFWEHVFWARKAGFSIDLEFDPKLLDAVNPSKIERIVSMHDFGASDDNLDLQWETMSAIAGSTVKIAVQTNDATKALPVWRLLKQAQAANKQIIPIAMGEAGKWTRILGLAHGAFMTYASLDESNETAAGQIPAKDMVEVYRVKELDLDTKVFGVIGDPVSESLSPYMHNAAFAEQSINAVFIPLQVRDLDEFMRRMLRPETREIELNFGGFAVTMPHKLSIIKYLDAIDPTAEKIGAVNTVKIHDGKLFGHNTDAYGFITPLKEKFDDLKGVQVSVFGSGGAARACVFALRQENAYVTVVARNKIKGKEIAEEFDVRFEHHTTRRRPLTTDIVVNATPVGMKGPLENESLFTSGQLEGVKFVYDLVTHANVTPIIREATKVGVPAMGGLEMLIHQGAKQFELWTGESAPTERMKEAVLKKTETQK